MARTTLCAIALSSLACGGGGHPTDQQLLDRFTQHRAVFEQLVTMFRADKGLGRVGESFTRPDNPESIGVPAARVAEYRRLCSIIGAPDCIEGYEPTPQPGGALRSPEKDPIWIHASGLGLSISGSSKGYVYTPAPPFEVVEALDGLTSPRSHTWLRRIEGHWYLYYDVED